MHPRYLSNAFVVGEGRGGAAVFVDSGAPITPHSATAGWASSTASTSGPAML